MQSHYSLAFTFLCSLSFLSAVLSIECNMTQYPWPRNTKEFCCDRCPPGKHMEHPRKERNCHINCVSCLEGQYKHGYNVDLSCDSCRKCTEPNMEYESPCDSIRNAVCKCKAGYRCSDESCKECVQISATITDAPPLPPAITDALPSSPATTISNTLPQPYSSTLQPPTQVPKPAVPIELTLDTMWLPAIVVLLCVVVAIFVVAKIPHFHRWIRHKLGNILHKKPAAVFTISEDEEVSKPIQEVCGKCDQLLDV